VGTMWGQNKIKNKKSFQRKTLKASLL